MKKNQIITIKLDRSYLFDAGGKAFDHAGDVLQVRVLDVLTNYIRVVTLDGERDYEVSKKLVQAEPNTMNTELYGVYTIIDNSHESRVIETLWLQEAKDAADKAQTQHPTSRVIVVQWNSADNRDTVVYEATKAEETKDPYAPMGVCAVCGGDAWCTTRIGLLCPTHEPMIDAVYAVEEAQRTRDCEPATFTTYSEIFCCGNCHDAVRIEEAQGGDLVYQCSNPACQKAVSVDCPEALALIEDVVLKLSIRKVKVAA